MSAIIRPVFKNDYHTFYALFKRNKTRLLRYFPNTFKATNTLAKASEYLSVSEVERKSRKKFLFGIFEGDKMIGYINVKNLDWDVMKCEIGYFIDEAYENMGIMTSKLKEIIGKCFEELGLLKIYLRIAKENAASIKVAEKLGFQLEGIMRQEFRIETGELIDVAYYGLLHSEK